MLFCEPKNRKFCGVRRSAASTCSFSALLRAEKSEIAQFNAIRLLNVNVSVLFCEPKNRKSRTSQVRAALLEVSVLFCEPKNRKPRYPPKQFRVTPVSVLFCEPKNRKRISCDDNIRGNGVSVLFCEPKNRKPRPMARLTAWNTEFQCSSASRKIGNLCTSSPRHSDTRFSALLRAEKSEIDRKIHPARQPEAVSVLFCEPKNRKSGVPGVVSIPTWSFSALLRAEKSESVRRPARDKRFDGFSALLRAEKSETYPSTTGVNALKSFSALLRAEKSEIDRLALLLAHVALFQCSSASRKIGNDRGDRVGQSGNQFQCSSASRKIGNFFARVASARQKEVSVLFCEPKNRNRCAHGKRHAAKVSVLFCEPKNRKLINSVNHDGKDRRFSALLRAEKSEMS